MSETTIDQLMSLCKVRTALAFAFEEEAHMTQLLADNLTEDELMWVAAHRSFVHPMEKVLTALLVERLENPSCDEALVAVEDVAVLSSRLYDAAVELLPPVSNTARLQDFVTGVADRLVSFFLMFCAVIHNSQRAAVTTLTMAATVRAAARKVSLDALILDAAMRAEVIKGIAEREAWLQGPMRPCPEKYSDVEGIVASFSAAYVRRARQIWG